METECNPNLKHIIVVSAVFYEEKQMKHEVKETVNFKLLLLFELTTGRGDNIFLRMHH